MSLLKSSPSSKVKSKSLLLNIFSYAYTKVEFYETSKLRCLSHSFLSFQLEMQPFADKYFLPFNKLDLEYHTEFSKYKNIDAIVMVPKSESRFIAYSASQGCLWFLEYIERNIIEHKRYMLDSYVMENSD